MSRILVVEDDPAILRSLHETLKRECYEVLTAADGETGYRLVREKSPDLVILDLMLPKLSGYEICRKMRSDGMHTPILMLTARGDEGDRVLGLDLGADDYVSKPFSLLPCQPLRLGRRAATTSSRKRLSWSALKATCPRRSSYIAVSSSDIRATGCSRRRRSFRWGNATRNSGQADARKAMSSCCVSTPIRTRLPPRPASGCRRWSGPEASAIRPASRCARSGKAGGEFEGSPSPDGRYLSFHDWDTGDLAVRDLVTGQNRRLTNKGTSQDSDEFAESSVISGDGRQIAYAWYNKEKFYELRVIGIDGSNPRTVYRDKRVWPLA